ncbi:SDR family NAD(P)-dependent oxidoreductase [Massilia cavernae]|uniref:SDR family oxidoreductase n=1 Tax=Massilia cavernae TaxID=2320864 RepID=A0A418Y0S1_9BURK|nr:SDR family oxidoreductase [Massilia cavernae]RJG18846.1 SDR family oxidoreductase [Massilia cavernae]
MKKLQGKVFIVTGAARMRGIGRATALRLAADGADVVVSAMARAPADFPDHERAAGWRGVESLAAEIAQLGQRSLALDCDVSNAAQVQAMVAATIAKMGRIDGVVNNAGVAGGAGAAPILDLDEADWQRTLDVNLNGVFLVSKYVGRALLEQGQGGAIVNLSSLAGRMGMAGYGGYCASKFGVVGLTQQMAQELARHAIRVNCVCPGSVETDMMDGTFSRIGERTGAGFDKIKSGTAKGIPMRRQGHPEEQAAAISFLLGPDAAYMTGQTINVDGGVRMD